MIIDAVSIARFWSKVVIRAPSECWLWTMKPNANGYGEIKLSNKVELAHRVAFSLAFGDPPSGHVIRHQCDEPLCCNPTHLVTGTHADNVKDRVSRGRSAKGSRNGRAILDETKVLAIRNSPPNIQKLASLYGVSPYTIMDVRSRRIWKHI